MRGEEGGPEGFRRAEQSRRDTAHLVRVDQYKSDCAGGGGTRQEAACARLGGYLFVSDTRNICTMEVGRALAISGLVGRSRARLHRLRDAKKRKCDDGSRVDVC
jgi:hypothetical protein